MFVVPFPLSPWFGLAAIGPGTIDELAVSIEVQLES